MKNVIISAITAIITTLVVMFIMHSMHPAECEGHKGCSKSKTECSKDGKKCSKANAKECKKDCKKACCTKSAEAKTCKKGCTKPCCAKKAEGEVSDSTSVEVAEAKVYACPMKCEGDHVHAEAGACSVCGMDLEEVVASAE